MMPGCEEQFDQGVTILQFYLHMEEASHANWLFNNSNHTCLLGCRKGFINAHSLLRHYLLADCQPQSSVIGEASSVHTLPHLGHDDYKLACKSCSLSFPDRQVMWTHCTDVHSQMVGSFTFAQTLDISTNLWLVPLKYTSAFPSRIPIASITYHPTYQNARWKLDSQPAQ
jgi:hypothetical protein